MDDKATARLLLILLINLYSHQKSTFTFLQIILENNLFNKIFNKKNLSYIENDN